jgi:hypothetical protein
LVPQLGAPWSAQRDRTSLPPLATFAHVPGDPLSAHDLQTPVQADWQQTPCSQKLERHSAFVRQTAPFGLRPQEPFMHTAGGWHSLLVVQIGRHAFAPQMNGKQAFAAGVTQVPAPSQVDSGVACWVVVGHVAAAHGVPELHF